MSIRSDTQRLTLTSMLLASGILLPFATAHGFGVPGTVLLPMHIPVFLCGLLCGPLYGGICGLLLPVLNSLLTNMPALYPMLPIMAAELLVYGCLCGLLYQKTPLRRYAWGVYPAMLVAMLGGRVAYGLMYHLLLMIGGTLKAPTVWAAIATGVPGMVVQLLLVPGIVWTLARVERGGRAAAIRSAQHLIEQNTASCVVIDKKTIVRTVHGRGIAPILSLHDEQVLQGAFVVDKVVGRAAAMVMTHGGVIGCYGATMSRGAYEWFCAKGVDVGYGALVDAIINREGNGFCPMEQAVHGIEDEEQALAAVRQTLERLRALQENKS